MSGAESTEQIRAQIPGLAELRRFGPASQSAVAGLYAWAVTVAPIAWAPLAPKATWVLALVAPGALASAVVLESLRPRAALHVSVWGTVFSSVAVWVRASEIPSSQLDPARAVLGFLGWGAFAFVAAAPPLGQANIDRARSEHAPAFVTRTPKSRLKNVAALAVGALSCGLLQWPRSDGASQERDIFVRVVAVAASLLIAARAGDIVASASRKVTPSRLAQRVAFPLLALFGCGALGVGLFFFLN